MHSSPEGSDDWYEPDCAAGTSTDELIAEVVAASVLSNPFIRGGHLKIQVQNRVVILLGEVTSVEARKTIRGIAWGVPGVHDVCNRLSVVPAGD